MLKGYKTVLFNGIVGTLGVLEIADYSFLPDETRGIVLIAIAIAGVWLRLITTTPFGKKL